MKLKEIQQKFVDFVYRDDNSIKDVLDAQHPDLSMRIYKNNVVHNLLSAVSLMYPTVYAILGDKKFTELGRRYIKSQPSSDGNLDVYGIDFVDFLNNGKLVEGYIISIAKLDLDFHLSYIAKDYTVRALEDYKNISQSDYERIVFIVNPTVRVSCLQDDVLDTWKEYKKKSLLPKRHNYQKKKNYIVIYRNIEVDVCTLRLNNTEYKFLQEALNGESLYKIYSTLEDDLQKCSFVDILNKLIINNIVVGFYLNK